MNHTTATPPPAPSDSHAVCQRGGARLTRSSRTTASQHRGRPSISADPVSRGYTPPTPQKKFGLLGMHSFWGRIPWDTWGAVCCDAWEGGGAASGLCLVIPGGGGGQIGPPGFWLTPPAPPPTSENHLAEVVRSKPGRRIYGENATYPPIWAYLRTLPQGVEMLV